MPHPTDANYSLIQVTPLGNTFAAEVSGVDFSRPVSPDVFAQIRKAIAQVREDQDIQSQIKS